MGRKAPTCYLNTRQAAEILGLSPRTLETYRVTGGGPPFLTYCNRVHYLRSDLDAWAIAGRRGSTTAAALPVDRRADWTPIGVLTR